MCIVGSTRRWFRMGVRKGVYVGFWCPPEVKKSLQEIATSEHRSLSQELNRLVEEFVRKRREPVTTAARQVEEARP
jgi:hypothetical protein